MDLTLLILIILVVVTAGIALWRGGGPMLLTALKMAVLTFKSMWFRVLLGMTLGGMIQVLIPSQLIAELLGPASGLKGIFIGSYTGALMGGGPYVNLPIIAAIYEAGAGAGPIIAMLSGIILSIQGLLTWRIPILGARLALTRYAVCILVPPLIGFAGGLLYQLIYSG
jgi:uncharacterized membrane protein YraQ (UPF0718 family)